MTKNENDPVEPGKKWLIIVAIMMLLAWLANLGWGIWAMDNDRTKGGEWGDIFGAVNALFSGAAFLMIFRGYEMQRYEVKLAKRELEESKQQTKDQKASLDKQNEATEQQMFEITFFKLMEQIDKLLANSKLTKLERDIIAHLHGNGKIYWDEFPTEDWERKLYLENLNIEQN